MQPHVEAAAFAPPPPSADPFEDLRRELVNWAEPVIADRILDGYRFHGVPADSIRFVASQHRRLWRAILLQRQGIVEVLRPELQRDLVKVGLDADIADAIDQSVIEELIDIVLKRFRTSSGRVKGLSMILLGAAAEIGASRAVMHS